MNKPTFHLFVDGTTTILKGGRTAAFNASERARESGATVVVLFENGQEIERFEAFERDNDAE